MTKFRGVVSVSGERLMRMLQMPPEARFVSAHFNYVRQRIEVVIEHPMIGSILESGSLQFYELDFGPERQALEGKG